MVKTNGKVLTLRIAVKNSQRIGVDKFHENAMSRMVHRPWNGELMLVQNLKHSLVRLRYFID